MPRSPPQLGQNGPHDLEMQNYGESSSLNESGVGDGSQWRTASSGRSNFNDQGSSSNFQTLPTRSPKKSCMVRSNHQIESGLTRTAGSSSSAFCTMKRTRFSSMRIRKEAMSRSRDELDDVLVIENISADPQLNKADAESEQLRLEVIRDIHCSLHKKRRLKKTVSSNINEAAAAAARRRAGRGTSIRFRIKQSLRVMRAKTCEGLRRLDPWRGHLRTLEGHFGGSIAYYFYFLQQLVFLNLVIFLISISFILIPQLLWRSGADSQNQTAMPPEGGKQLTALYGNETAVGRSHRAPKRLLLEEKQPDDKTSYSLITNSEDEDDDNEEPEFKWTDLFTGAGYLASSELYYGAYVNETISMSGSLFYNLPLAYLLATVCHLLVCLCLLARWVANAYKTYIEYHSGYGVRTFCNLLFCAWDFSITSVEAAKFKSIGLLQEFEEKLQLLRKDSEPMTCLQKIGKFFRVATNWIIVLAILTASGVIVWHLLDSNAFEIDIPVLEEMTLPLTVTFFLILLPFVFSLLITWEGYREKSTEVYCTMIRMMALLLTVLGVLCYFWFAVNYGVSNTDLCWENRLGEEVYRLLLVDFLIVNSFSLLLGAIHTYLLKRKIVQNPEFNLAWNTWNLIYTQMLCWLGSFYFPMISGLVIIKLLLTFYIKQLHIKISCTPPAKPWGASQTRIIFLSFAFLGLIAMLVPVGYSIIAMTPSQKCGPFSGQATVYDVIVDVLQGYRVNSEALGHFMYFVSLPGCVAGILIVLCAIAFQAKSHAHATQNLVERLQHQVQLDAKDKVFLLQLLDKATRALEMKESGPICSLHNGSTVRFTDSLLSDSSFVNVIVNPVSEAEVQAFEVPTHNNNNMHSNTRV